MNTVDTLQRIRTVLFLLAGLLYAGTIGELIAVKHYDETLQLLPFALCGIGLICLWFAMRQPSARTVLGIRIVSLAIAAGGAFGLWEHLEGNASFYQEIHPHATSMELMKQAITGRNPMMAPGILAVAALLTVLVTFAGNALAAHNEVAEPARSDRHLETRTAT